MAARKSCTHLTWAEAKGKVGEGKGKGGKKAVPKNVPHGKLLADKIIMKQQPAEKDKIADRQAARRARKDEERAKRIEEKRREEKEQQRLAVVKPHEQSLERIKALSEIIQKEAQNGLIEDNDYNLDTLKTITECKQSQLDEILALQAMFINEEFRISDECALNELQCKVEEVDETDEVSLKSIARHPPISFTLQTRIDDERGDDLVADILLRVQFPNLYPFKDGRPCFEVVYFMVTDKTAVCNANKPLETQAFLDESNLVDAMDSEATTLLPYPCVYEIVSTWLPENLFPNFITLKPI